MNNDTSPALVVPVLTDVKPRHLSTQVFTKEYQAADPLIQSIIRNLLKKRPN